MGTAVSWIDRGAEGFRVYIDIPLRKNGLPPLPAAKAVSKLLEAFNPAAFDPPEPVSEAVAVAAMRDLGTPQGINEKYPPEGVPHFEMTADDPPLPDFGIPVLDAGLLPDDDEIIFPRACAVGGCGEE